MMSRVIKMKCFCPVRNNIGKGKAYKIKCIAKKLLSIYEERQTFGSLFQAGQFDTPQPWQPGLSTQVGK